MLRSARSTVFRSAAAATLAAVPVLGGCRDRLAIRPDQLVRTDTLVAYALTGTPATAPSALSLVYGTTVRVDGSAAFDVGFDFDSTGAVIVSPVRLLVNAIARAPQVGLRQVPGPFESIKEAPTGYYRPDTALVVRPGEPFIALATRATGSVTCYYSTSPRLYAKVVIDSVFPATTRAIYLRTTIDPNCGYRSFAENTFPTF